ncbi:Twitching motility protein [Labeo rohita]|uniref:Twitching motility protein n=1 Tax=Labeo rohita TaxID=84645 RepID=A0ABQ8L3L7_LABRO|nr:Twitching motility protein [Labeo rohita]
MASPLENLGNEHSYSIHICKHCVINVDSAIVDLLGQLLCIRWLFTPTHLQSLLDLRLEPATFGSGVGNPRLFHSSAMAPCSTALMVIQQSAKCKQPKPGYFRQHRNPGQDVALENGMSEKLDAPLKSELRGILLNSKSIEGPTTRYLLNPTVLTDGKLLRRERIGQKNEEKPRKVILMIGETGTGKSTLINAMINYIMDTPGFGDTEDFNKDKNIAEALQQLFRSEDGIHEMHASECYEEEDRESYKTSWDQGIENFGELFKYLNGINPKSLNMTEGVLRARKQLDASVNNLRDRIELAELKKQELEQTKTALDRFKNYREEQNNFQCVVDEPYKDEVPINASWWYWSKQATRCTVCQENCHYPGCWWVRDLSWCSVMSKGQCTVCSGRCHHTQHVKDSKRYVNKTRKVTRTNDDLKRKYEKEFGEKQSMMAKLETEIRQIEAEKIRLVEECYQCLEKLMETALKSTSISSFIHLDFMIEKVKESGKQERVMKLEELKKRAAEENKGLADSFYGYWTRQ